MCVVELNMTFSEFAVMKHEAAAHLQKIVLLRRKILSVD